LPEPLCHAEISVKKIIKIKNKPKTLVNICQGIPCDLSLKIKIS